MTKSNLCFLISLVLLYTVQVHAQENETNVVAARYTVESIDFDLGPGKPAYKPKKLLGKLGFEKGDDAIWAETGRDNLQAFYYEKGFAFAQVTLKSEQGSVGKLKLTYRISEGPQVSIGKVSFSGNDSIKTDAFKKALKTTTNKWFFWPRDYTEKQVTEDVKRISGIYWEKGYLGHSITYSLNPNILEPAIVAQQLQQKKSKINIDFAVDEGPVYTVEKILLLFFDAEGKIIEEIVLKSSEPSEQQPLKENKAFHEEYLRSQVELEPGQIYSERTARSDVERLRKLYGESGFINARVRLLSPVFIQDAHAVNIEYEIFEGRQYRIGRIDITGNKETHDRAIRKILDEYEFFPGNLYNSDLAPVDGGGKLERKIKMMTLAEAISITPMGQAYGPEDANVLGQDVEVNMKEGLTGNIWPGVGMSSDHGFIGQLIYDERNFDITDWPESLSDLIPGRSFRGAGQTFRIGLEPGTYVSQYSVSFGDPYWGGEPNKPIRLGIGGSDWERDRESYDEGRTKGYFSFDKRFNKGRWSQGISFRAENVTIDDIDIDAPTEILDVEGDNFLAGIKFGIEQNLTDDEYNPTTGTISDLSYEQVAGDHTFGILKGTQRWYRTLHEDLAERKTVLAIKLLGATTVSDAPPFEKFYGGGTGTYGIRGFDYRGVSTRGINTITLERDDPIGSDWIFLANAEITVPLVSDNFAVLFFVDSGAIDSGSYRASVGTGIQILLPQWFGPVPMRFELGVPFLKDDDDDTRTFNFSVGRLF
ncbi:MAG: BamA/OMP85 family outer membrane protein [Planctomycetota bacterium]